MVIARFAHEGAIVRLAFTPDGTKLVSLAEDRTIKVWRTSDYSELKLWENQPDVATAAGVRRRRRFVRGRADGRFAGDLCDPGRRAGRDRAASRNSREAGCDAANGLGRRRCPSTNRTTFPTRPTALTLPATRHRRDRAGGRRTVRFRLLPLHGQSRRAMGVRGRTRPVRSRSWIRTSRSSTARAGACRECSCRRCATRISRSAARTTARPAIFASSTGKRCESMITCMPTARS